MRTPSIIIVAAALNMATVTALLAATQKVDPALFPTIAVVLPSPALETEVGSTSFQYELVVTEGDKDIYNMMALPMMGMPAKQSQFDKIGSYAIGLSFEVDPVLNGDDSVTSNLHITDVVLDHMDKVASFDLPALRTWDLKNAPRQSLDKARQKDGVVVYDETIKNRRYVVTLKVI